MRLKNLLMLMALSSSTIFATVEFKVRDCFPNEREQEVVPHFEQNYEPEWVDNNDFFYGDNFYRRHDRFAIQGELLYLKPTIDQPFFVITSTNNRFGGEFYPNGKRHHLQTPYKPGFRVEAMYDFYCGNELDLRFTYLNTRHCHSISGDFLVDTIGFPGDGAQSPEDTTYAGTADFCEQFRYYAGDLTFNRVAFNCCPDNLTFLIGLHFAYIQRKEHLNSFGSFISDSASRPLDNNLRRNSIFWGIGPEIGVDYIYRFRSCFCGSWGIFGNARGSILASHTEASLHYITNRTGPVGVNLDNDGIWRVTPAIDARLGLSYDFNLCCFNGVFEFGYEWLFYSDAIDMITGYDVAFPGDTIDLYSNLNLQGPFVALRIDF